MFYNINKNNDEEIIKFFFHEGRLHFLTYKNYVLV